MPKKYFAAAGAAVGLVLATAGMAAACCPLTTGSPSHHEGGSFNNPPIWIGGEQRGLINANAPLVDLRCATPWYGSAVLGGTTPLHTQNIVCDYVGAPVEQIQDGPQGGLLF